MNIALRISVITLAAGIIALILYYLLGRPSVSRLDTQDKIARFSPTVVHGIIQFVGELFLLV